MQLSLENFRDFITGTIWLFIHVSLPVADSSHSNCSQPYLVFTNSNTVCVFANEVYSYVRLKLE